jgi:GNAT superfamily N-acetyltransferase
MPYDLALSFKQAVHAYEVSPQLRQELIECWITVINGGGAVGFPFPPVSSSEVEPVADRLIAGLEPRFSRLLSAMADGALAGWLNIRRDSHPVVMHWGTVNSVQTHFRFRGRGIGAGLMNCVRQTAVRKWD